MLFYFFFTAVFPISVNDKSIMAVVRPKTLQPSWIPLSLLASNTSPNPVSSNLLSPSLLCPCPSIPAFFYSILFSAQQPLWACQNDSLILSITKIVHWLCISLITKAWGPSIWHDQTLCWSLTLHHLTYPTPAMLISWLLFLHNRHPRTKGPLLVLCLEGSSLRELHGHFPPLLHIFAEMAPSHRGLPDTTLYCSLASFATLFFSIYSISYNLTWYIF